MTSDDSLSPEDAFVAALTSSDPVRRRLAASGLGDEAIYACFGRAFGFDRLVLHAYRQGSEDKSLTVGAGALPTYEAVGEWLLARAWDGRQGIWEVQVVHGESRDLLHTFTQVFACASGMYAKAAKGRALLFWSHAMAAQAMGDLTRLEEGLVGHDLLTDEGRARIVAASKALDALREHLGTLAPPIVSREKGGRS